MSNESAVKSKNRKSFVEKKARQMQKREYEKLAIQNLPKRLIKMQNKQVLYNVGNFFLFPDLFSSY